ncbi:hypothetical protein [Kordiimonas sp. SCSIO 12610]|uniref:hypothetical protein n=1 Tax=Kordiimonas sp. SCSIO 12610 TaxID=2829597 RepID=UPI00210D52D6|nr:hypothetical protein [Kordiimonas sp. SCSIO 12610]UTW54298.1 hypothetical protein KFF44_10765 [Kordiimonas sp. SCSIO 12610]
MTEFTHFIGIDWSGAKGRRHKGIQIALVEKDNHKSPLLISPVSGNRYWSRKEVADWLNSGAGLPPDARILIGIDAAFGMPYLDQGSYFPENTWSSDTVYVLWQHIADVCSNSEDYFGGAFADRFSDYFQQPGGRKGKYYSRRMRVSETKCIETKVGPCESVFNLVGASQVGKSALSTMIMLNSLVAKKDICVWPFMEAHQGRICFVEIYAALFAGLGGHKGKIRNLEALNKTLRGLNSAPFDQRNNLDDPSFDDNQADALITAAGLRYISDKPEYWKPEGLSPKVRETEGWIFGVR